MVESGKVQKILSKMTGPETSVRDCSKQGLLTPISIGKTALILVVLFGGILLSFAILLCETIIFRKQ